MRMNLPVTGRDVSISDTANILSTTDLDGDITYVNPDFIASADSKSTNCSDSITTSSAIRTCPPKPSAISGHPCAAADRGWAW
jgi:aerotaxis receptor